MHRQVGVDIGSTFIDVVAIQVATDETEYEMPGKANKWLKRDDLMIVDTCGGGGYGAPENHHPVTSRT